MLCDVKPPNVQCDLLTEGNFPQVKACSVTTANVSAASSVNQAMSVMIDQCWLACGYIRDPEGMQSSSKTPS